MREISFDSTKAVIGQQGEQAVVDYLLKDGFTILARNFRARSGEVDIITRKSEVLAFVEVKARQQIYFNLSEVILPEKQRKIIKAARFYINQYRIQGNREMVYRFDIALVEKNQNAWNITYIPNAFTDYQEGYL